jgi:hypothetical protein
LTREYLPAIKRAFFRLYCVKPLYGKNMATSSSPKSIAASRTLQVVKTVAALAPGRTGDIVVDGFESGDFSSPGYPNFSWGAANGIRFVGSSPEYPAKTGNSCMVIRYPAGSSFIEQNFEIAAPGASDLWMGFDMRVPTNYFHNDLVGTVGENQKFFRLWCTTYEGHSAPGGGTKLGMEFRRVTQTDLANGSSYYYAKIFNEFQSGGDKGNVPFINVPADQGVWMSFIFHFKMSSGVAVADGMFEVWRKREGDVDYAKEFDFQAEHIPFATNGGGQYLAHADFMGYANAPYTVDTEFLFDNFVLTTNPLI